MDALPDDLARQSHFQLLTRLGFVARGILYIVVGFLAIDAGRTEDLTGALEYLGRGRTRVLLAVMALGMAIYGIWRVADAALGIENPGQDGKAYRKRAAAGLVGVAYLLLAYKAVSLLQGEASSDGGTQQQAGKALDLPGGEWVLGLIGVAIIAAGVFQLVKGLKCKFMARFDARAQQPFVRWLGTIGYAARGAIFIAIGWLMFKAALASSATDAGGMEQALDLFKGPLEYAVALGLMLFGGFSLIEARYRRIHEPPVDGLKHDLRERLPS
jgi:hypothetical protein